MNAHPDVIVIGGGPAGLAAAITLGHHKVPVSLLDRQSLPADKVCGEGIMPPGLAFLEEIGAHSLLSPADKAPFAGIRYLVPSGRSMQAEFEAGPGRGIRRTALSRALLTVASELPSVTIHQGARVTGVQPRAGLMEVAREVGAPLTCRLVVGADGLRSRVRQWARLDGPPARHQRFGVRQHYRLAPWSRYVEVHSGPGREAYVTPCGPDCTGVAILWEPDRCPGAESGPRLFPSLLESFPVLHRRLQGAEPLDQPRSTGPFQQRTTRRTADGFALIGDASGYLDACTGEGLTLAFRQSRALQSCVLPALRSTTGGLLPASALRAYERSWRRIMRPYFLCTRVMLFLHRHPGLFDHLVGVLARRPDLLRHFLSFNMGLAPILPGLKRTARWFLPTHAEHP